MGEYQFGKPKAKSRKEQENKREQEIAKKLGGRRQPASGAGPQHKGDIKLKNFLLDSKACSTYNLIMPINEVTKIVRDADGEKLIPALYITLERLPETCPQEWVLLPATTFSAMLDKGMANGVEGSQYD